ncbi:MAG: uroporphyrinogen decarboxylase family protein [Coriobacteriia bacterium]|nr:uroporphyrinogen decarboxylase family protein [Coriobacteriia bacterium]
MPRLIDIVRSAETLPVFPIGGPCRWPTASGAENEWGAPEWLLAHADSWNSAFILTGIDDTTMCAAMAGPTPEGVYAREHYRQHPITDIGALRVPEPHDDAHLAPSLATLAAVAGRGHPVLASVWGPLTIAATLMGVDYFLRTALQDPMLLDEIIGFASTAVAHYVDAALGTGADYLWVAEPLAALFSPTLFARHGDERLTDIVNIATSHETECVLHVCGDTSHLTELLTATGAAGLSVDAAVNLVDTAKHSGPNVVIMGNLWPMDLLSKSPEEIAEATRRMVDSMAGRAYIAATGCSCPVGTPVENLAAFIDTARRYPGLRAAPNAIKRSLV